MVNEIEINLALTPKSQELYNNITQLLANTKPIQINLDLEPPNATAITNIKNQLTSGLNTQPITLTNLQISSQALNGLRQQIQVALNQPFAINVNANVSGTAKNLSGNVGNTGTGGFIGPTDTRMDDFNRRTAQFSNMNSRPMTTSPYLLSNYMAQAQSAWGGIGGAIGEADIQRARQQALAQEQQFRVQEEAQRQAYINTRSNTALRNPYLANAMSGVTSDFNSQMLGGIDIYQSRQQAIQNQYDYNRRTAAFSPMSANPNYIYGNQSGFTGYGPSMTENPNYIFGRPGNQQYGPSAALNPNYIYGNQSGGFGGGGPIGPMDMYLHGPGGGGGGNFGPFDTQSDDYNRRTAAFSSMSDRPRSFFEKMTSETTKREVGLSSLLAASHGDFKGAIGGAVGGFIGGGMTGTSSGARIGGTVGIGVVDMAIGAFNAVKDTLMGAAEAGLTFQRSILGIAGTLSQSSHFVGANGEALDVGAEVGMQRSRAKRIQLAARSQAAQVGIGGEAESALVQAILTGAGSRGIELNEGQAATLTQRLGSALNVFAPELASQPTIVRRDMYDILRGSPQASRTALGSRIGGVVEQLKTATNGDDMVRATNALQNLVMVFQNSGDAITQIQRFNAIMEITKTNFGEAIVDQLGPSIQEFVNTLNDKDVSQSLISLGQNIGTFFSSLISTGSQFMQFMSTAAPTLKSISDGLTGLGIGTPTRDLTTENRSSSRLASLRERSEKSYGTQENASWLDDVGSLLNQFGAFKTGENSTYDSYLNQEKFQPDNSYGYYDNNGKFQKKKAMDGKSVTNLKSMFDNIFTEVGGKNQTGEELTKNTFEYKQAGYEDASTKALRYLNNPGLVTDSSMTPDMIVGTLLSGNAGQISSLQGQNAANMANALPTIGGQLRSLNGSNTGQQLDLARQSLFYANTPELKAEQQREVDRLGKQKYGEDTQKLDQFGDAANLLKAKGDLETKMTNFGDVNTQLAMSFNELRVTADGLKRKMEMDMLSGDQKIISEARQAIKSNGGLTNEQSMALQTRSDQEMQRWRDSGYQGTGPSNLLSIAYGEPGGLDEQMMAANSDSMKLSDTLNSESLFAVQSRYAGQSASNSIAQRDNLNAQNNLKYDKAATQINLAKVKRQIDDPENMASLTEALSKASEGLKGLVSAFTVETISAGVTRALAADLGP